jgi:hypothetical protein
VDEAAGRPPLHLARPQKARPPSNVARLDAEPNAPAQPEAQAVNDPDARIIRVALARLEAELDNVKLLIESAIEAAETRGYQRALEDRGHGLPDD